MSVVQRLVPDELWELFEQVVPPKPTRPQDGGRRRYEDRQVLAAIVFVATSGCGRGRSRYGQMLVTMDRE